LRDSQRVNDQIKTALERGKREIRRNQSRLALTDDLEEIEVTKRLRIAHRLVARFAQFDRHRVERFAGKYLAHGFDTGARDMSGAKPKHAEKNGAAPKPPAIAGLPSGAPPAPATGAEKPKFDFYRILPGSEEPVSEKEIRERLRAKSGQQDAAKDVYFIQAGSFQNPADADNQKARLAILGFESSVEPANLPDKGTWYRVRMGPYAKLDEINKVRQALAQNGIDASLIKVKDQ
jgi:hypothetical protein